MVGVPGASPFADLRLSSVGVCHGPPADGGLAVGSTLGGIAAGGSAIRRARLSCAVPEVIYRLGGTMPVNEKTNTPL